MIHLSLKVLLLFLCHLFFRCSKFYMLNFSLKVVLLVMVKIGGPKVNSNIQYVMVNLYFKVETKPNITFHMKPTKYNWFQGKQLQLGTVVLSHCHIPFFSMSIYPSTEFIPTNAPCPKTLFTLTLSSLTLSYMYIFRLATFWLEFCVSSVLSSLLLIKTH